MDGLPLWLPAVFFVIATVYATVGFGGGTAYLAALAVVGLPYQAIPQVSLACNIVVTASGVWHFRRGGHITFGWVLPFVALSVPMAYVGGRLPVGRQLFLILLGTSLLLAGLRMLFPGRGGHTPQALPVSKAWLFGLPIGAALGFLSGVVGVGGGVFLAPVLILAGWANAKTAAGVSALFIFVNSAAGLAGQLSKAAYLDAAIFPLLLAVFLGGQLGSRLGAYRLPVAGVQRLLAALILFVSLRVAWEAI